MDEGAQLLISHIEDEAIFIQIDSDCDGLTSAAILVNYLRRAFPTINLKCRMHEGKQHGLIPETIPDNVKLAIAPDSSSNSVEECKILQERGIDVLIIDHHLSDNPPTDAVVINNQLCNYPSKSLSGAGVVYKFCQYLDLILNLNYADDYLDLAALGMIGDVMDLRDYEIHRIIQLGLKKLYNPFFRSMVEKQAYSLGDELTPIGVAFYIVPYMNAIMRSGTQEEKELLFAAMLEHEALERIPSTKRGAKGTLETRVEQACRTCTNVKNRQSKLQDAGMEIIEKIIQENNLDDNKIIAIRLEKDSIDKNLTGLLANKIMSKYRKPVLVLKKDTTEDGHINWSGSGRGVNQSRLTDLRSLLLETGLVLFAEGHEQAFGTCIPDENFETFIDFTNKLLKSYDFSKNYKVDYIYNSNEVNSSDILDIASLKSLWGTGIEESLIVIENVKVTSENVILMSKDKNPTLKITLPNGLALIKFKSSQEEYDSLTAEGKFSILNIVGKCSANVWGGRTTPQLLIEEYEKSCEGFDF